jgi:hypothetical protein
MATVGSIIEELKDRLVGVGGVQGIGATKGSPQQIVVYVDKLTPELKGQVPPVLGGFGVQIQEVGQVTAL